MVRCGTDMGVAMLDGSVAQQASAVEAMTLADRRMPAVNRALALDSCLGLGKKKCREEEGRKVL